MTNYKIDFLWAFVKGNNWAPEFIESMNIRHNDLDLLDQDLERKEELERRGQVKVALLTLCNSRIKNILESKGYKRFIPFAPATIVKGKEPNSLEICYYFDSMLHKLIFESTPNYVMQPSGELYIQLEYLYQFYSLDGWSDRRINV